MLDHRVGWNNAGDELTANVDGARADVAGLVFGAFRLALDIPTGDPTVTIVLGVDDATPLNVTVTADTLAIGDCAIPRAEQQTLTIERRGDRITLATDRASQVCDVRLPEHLSIHWTAQAGAHMSRISLQRL